MNPKTHPSRPNIPEQPIGYWGEGELHPSNFVDENWDVTQRELVIAYLEAGQTRFSFRGCSRCRFCGKMNGSRCLTDGTYIWPSGFVHYLREHGVKPTAEFIQHVLS